MPWEAIDWSQEKKDKYNKSNEQINKNWGENQEKNRKGKVASAFELEKDKLDINSEISRNANQSFSSKSQKM